jgi:hypothetical protein
MRMTDFFGLVGPFESGEFVDGRGGGCSVRYPFQYICYERKAESKVVVIRLELIARLVFSLRSMKSGHDLRGAGKVNAESTGCLEDRAYASLLQFTPCSLQNTNYPHRIQSLYSSGDGFSRTLRSDHIWLQLCRRFVCLLRTDC